MGQKNKEIDVARTKRKIRLLFILGIAIIVLPILFVLFLATHVSIMHPS